MGLFENQAEKMKVVTKEDKGCCSCLIKALRDFRAYDSQKYIDMMAGLDDASEMEFQVPSDNQEQSKMLKSTRDTIYKQ